MSSEAVSEFDAKAAQLVERCDNAGIQHKRKDFNGEPFLTVQLPNGRRSRQFVLRPGQDTIDSLLSIPFEEYTFLGDYIAIACYNDQTLEAAVTPTRGPSRDLFSREFGEGELSDDSNDATPEPITIRGGDVAPNCAIVIGPCSDAFQVLNHRPIVYPDGLMISIQISGVAVATHDEAVDTLERLTNSLFFQVDLACGIAVSLRRDPLLKRRLSARRRETTAPQIEFPRTEYDSAPITLYWYGRLSSGMPLLQFLAFYQCVEFYFPTYFQAEQKRRIRNILKSPTFRPDREGDIGRVLAAMNSTGRKGTPDEKSMLRATIHECLDARTLRAFLQQTEQRSEFFSTRAKGLTTVKLPIGNADADLRDPVADRIYDIRCKIVHTKTGAADDVELLLPFSKEAQLLDEDIALMEFIAQNVLIAGSSTLRLPVEPAS